MNHSECVGVVQEALGGFAKILCGGPKYCHSQMFTGILSSSAELTSDSLWTLSFGLLH